MRATDLRTKLWRGALAPFLLTLVCASAFSQSVQPPSRRAAAPAGGLYRIAGKVVNAITGDPVGRATVAALDEADSHTVESAESDNNGQFVLEGLPAAKYQLSASRRGFRTGFYDEHEEFNSAIVTGPDQDTGHLIFRISPGVSLRGTVTGDGGDPVEGARVMLFLVPAGGQTPVPSHGPNHRIEQAETATTDDTGAFEFGSLTAGKYLMAVMAEPWYALHKFSFTPGQKSADNASAALDVAYPTTFYDSTTDEAAATPIVLSAGERAEADVNLHAVPALHLYLPAAPKDKNAATAPLLQQSIFGMQVAFDPPTDANPGHSGWTEFTGVAPGHYQLSVGDPPRIVELDATASQQIDPAGGTSAVSVTGTLFAASGAELPEETTVALYATDGVHRPDQLTSTAHLGRFRFDSVQPGNWELWAWGSTAPAAVVSLVINGKTHAGNGIAVSDRPVSLAAVVAQGSTRVEGFARKGGQGVAGVMVVLVPRESTAFQARIRRDQSDSDGSFSLRDVVPGSYTAIAIADGWSLDWSEPSVLQRFLAKGIAVIVTSSSGASIRLAQPLPVESAMQPAN